MWPNGFLNHAQPMNTGCKMMAEPYLEFSPTDPMLRQPLRILSMVYELHEAEYQRIRICAGLSPSGGSWRCYVTDSNNVEPNGLFPKSWTEDVASYSSGAGYAPPFGWDDARGRKPRQLARMFVERFPRIAEAGRGEDRAYADWFAGMLAAARKGRLPVFFADYEIDLSSLSPPPPKRPRRRRAY